MVKICKICDKEKDISKFHKRKDSIDGYRNDCKDCRKNNIKKNYDSLELRCNTCKIKFPKTEEFFYKNNNSPLGFRTSCKTCENKRSKEYHLKNRYGLSVEEVNVLKKEGKCKICDSNEFRLVIDHCHTTGNVRGALCDQCNHGLGNFKDNEELLLKAIKYLKYQL